MHNLRTVISFEFFRTIGKRAFWLSALATALLIAVIFGISYFSNTSVRNNMDFAAGSADESEPAQSFAIVVYDESGLLTEAALTNFGAQHVGSAYDGLEHIRAGSADAFVHYPPDPREAPVAVYGQDLGIGSNGRYEYVAREMLRSSLLQEISDDQRRQLLEWGILTELTTYADGEPSQGFSAMIAPGFFLVLFFILLLLLGNQMLNSTTEEKENRVIEMMLTTVTARTVIVGKIVALVLLGLLQIAVIVVPVVIAIVFFSDALNIPDLGLSELVFDPGRIAAAVVLFVLAFLVVTGALVTVSAAMPTAKEASNFFGFTMLAAFVPLYAVVAILSSPEQLIVKAFSFFPLTAPVTLLLRNAVGNLAGWELALGLAILAASAVVALSSAIRAFKRGTLQYHRRLSLREIFGRS